MPLPSGTLTHSGAEVQRLLGDVAAGEIPRGPKGRGIAKALPDNLDRPPGAVAWPIWGIPHLARPPDGRALRV